MPPPSEVRPELGLFVWALAAALFAPLTGTAPSSGRHLAGRVARKLWWVIAFLIVVAAVAAITTERGQHGETRSVRLTGPRAGAVPRGPAELAIDAGRGRPGAGHRGGIDRRATPAARECRALASRAGPPAEDCPDASRHGSGPRLDAGLRAAEARGRDHERRPLTRHTIAHHRSDLT